MKDAIRLQGIGWVEARPADTVSPGESLMWNYGYSNKVIAVAPCGEKFLTFTLESQDGSTHQRKLKRSRLVAAYTPKLQAVLETEWIFFGQFCQDVRAGWNHTIRCEGS